MYENYREAPYLQKLSLSGTVMKVRKGIVIKNWNGVQKMVILHSIFQRGKYLIKS